MALIKCPECGRDVSDKAFVCIHCGYPIKENAEKSAKDESISTELPSQETSAPQEKQLPPQETTEQTEKESKPQKPLYKRWWFWLIIVWLCLGITGAILDEDTPDDNDNNATESADGSWRANLSSELVAEIESAFAEIGENPDNIVNVEYVDTHTSGYVFEQKCYKVEFAWSLFNPGYEHSRYYRIVTQNYYDGEPEKAQYPNEFLCTIKYWVGDEGHNTNVNQWSWTGNGEKQK